MLLLYRVITFPCKSNYHLLGCWCRWYVASLFTEQTTNMFHHLMIVFFPFKKILLVISITVESSSWSTQGHTELLKCLCSYCTVDVGVGAELQLVLFHKQWGNTCIQTTPHPAISIRSDTNLTVDNAVRERHTPSKDSWINCLRFIVLYRSRYIRSEMCYVCDFTLAPPRCTAGFKP